MAFTPRNTIAVIVGIEDYQISDTLARGARWDLDGPATDAVRFAKWLVRSRKVPAKNVHVFRSALKTAACDQEFGKLGITSLHDAKQHTLENFFLGQLSRLARGEDAQLFLLWGGHGVLRAAEHRLLYSEDVLPDSVRAIWVNSLLRCLKQMTRFVRQYVFVDACANAHEATDLKAPLYSELFAGDQPSGVQQYSLHAAAAGQLAVNLRDRHAGLFSSFLFEELEAQSGWPDFPALEASILKRFGDEVKTDPLFDQRPISIISADQTNRARQYNLGGTPVPPSLQALALATGYSVRQLQALAKHAADCRCLSTEAGRRHFYSRFAFPEPGVRGDDEYDRLNLLGRVLLDDKTGDFLAELRTKEANSHAYAELLAEFRRATLVLDARKELREVELGTSDYRRIFSLLLPDSEAATLEEMLDALAARGPSGSCLLFKFLFRVAACSASRDTALRAWVKVHAQIDHYLELEATRAESRSYDAVVSINPAPGKEEIPESLTVWLLENGHATGRSWTRRLSGATARTALWEEVKQQLECVLQQAIEAAETAVTVEIAIPLSLMRMEFHQLAIPKAQSKFKLILGKRYPLVLRWRDRHAPNAILENPWRAAASCIRNRLAASDPTMYELPAHPDEAYLSSLENPPGDFLYLGLVQPPASDEDPDWLQEVIIAGTPFAAWLTQPPPGKAVPEPLDKLGTAPFDELPRRVAAVRAAKASATDTLILLWDDPGRRRRFLLDEPV